MENSLSNKIQALTKSINMDNAVIGTFKRLFIIRVSYTQINLLKKLSSYGIVAKTRFSRFVYNSLFYLSSHWLMTGDKQSFANVFQNRCS